MDRPLAPHPLVPACLWYRLIVVLSICRQYKGCSMRSEGDIDLGEVPMHKIHVLLDTCCALLQCKSPHH